MTRAVMLALLALVAAGLLGIAQQGRESGTRGFDEIAYGSLQPDVLQPGQGMSQGADVQAPQLSQVAFLYSFAGPGDGLAHVTVRDGSGVLADTDVRLARTVQVEDADFWWIGSYWGEAARLQRVPVRSPTTRRVSVSITVPSRARPVALWRSSPVIGPHTFPVGPTSDQDPTKRYAIMTEYGPLQPALARAPTFAERISHDGAPWLPAPALWALAALTLAVVGWIVWQVAGAGPEGAGREG